MLSEAKSWTYGDEYESEQPSQVVEPPAAIMVPEEPNKKDSYGSNWEYGSEYASEEPSVPFSKK